jgi:hypothetical protein
MWIYTSTPLCVFMTQGQLYLYQPPKAYGEESSASKQHRPQRRHRLKTSMVLLTLSAIYQKGDFILIGVYNAMSAMCSFIKYSNANEHISNQAG